MERLTICVNRVDSRCAKVSSDLCREYNDCFYCPQYVKMVDRLAAYEDTGLEPEEVTAVKHSLMGKAIAEIEEFDSVPVSRLQELAQADKDGRLVVLPCKVGDTVYMPVGRFNTITGYEEDKCDGFHIARDGILQIKAQSYTGNHGTYGVPGKTVFLTREEAEAALEAQKGGEGNET